MGVSWLSHRVLNRTLLQRQHLLARTEADPLAMAGHLLGLQAQEPLPPYLSLAARLHDFDPAALSAALEDRSAVRLLLMRGTIHLVDPRDAWLLRSFVQGFLDKVARTSVTARDAVDVPVDELAPAVSEVLADDPLSPARLGEELAARFPGTPADALTHRARYTLPLVQVPPRGLWQQPGGVAYQTLQRWAGQPPAEPDPAEVVRRYLRAFGPAAPADLTAWSGTTGARALFASLGDELRSHTDEHGRALVDLDGLPLADSDEPAPVRLLGRYDNVWLSHDRRDRVTPEPAKRQRWMGVNGGVGSTVLVDGMLEGLWRMTESGRVEMRLFRALTTAERADLDAEVGRVEALLAPAAARE
ncbi:MAG: winged helix DNA-binding domain-containing protein [Nocardioidaceae bacterium]|nr:winged helix DNA-binding domain-containing protein [Nocardioidaceae bacterium]